MAEMNENADLVYGDLIGRTITKIEGCTADSDQIVLHFDNGDEYTMYHAQDCCESVRVADVVGDVLDLVDSPLLNASKRSENDPDAAESGTWTFYRFSTIKGTVVIRWYGSSNGYYSEEVTFERTVHETL